MDLARVKSEADRLGPWAYLATIGRDGTPHVVPVHLAWEGDTLWFMAAANSAKVRNLTHNPSVALHWQATQDGTGLALWGAAEVYSDQDTKRRLWDAFSYDLNVFAPDGPDNAPEAVFVAIRPRRALYVTHFGTGERDLWAA